jgi:hypothetical protein
MYPIGSHVSTARRVSGCLHWLFDFLFRDRPDINELGQVVELLSIYKRLRAFEATIHGEVLPTIDRDFIAATREHHSDRPILDG